MVRHTKLPEGTVKRISASLLLDQDVRWQGKSKVLVPPTPEKLKAIHDLVAGAIGLSADRGDQLVIESLPFEQTLESEQPLASEPMSAKPKTLMDTIAVDRRILIGAAVAVLLLILVPVLLFRKGGGKQAVAVEVAAQHAIAAPSAGLVTPADLAAERDQISKAAEESVQAQIKSQSDQKQIPGGDAGKAAPASGNHQEGGGAAPASQGQRKDRRRAGGQRSARLAR
jgi:flagellar biosynthesis/type III secretory pathway M-ring protein FliF/YscJ